MDYARAFFRHKSRPLPSAWEGFQRREEEADWIKRLVRSLSKEGEIRAAVRAYLAGKRMEG